MAIGSVRPQYFRQTVLPAQPRIPTITLYRGLKEDFRFLSTGAAHRLDILDRKFARSIEPSFFDRFLSALTQKPIMSRDERKEFFSLRSIGCDQSFSDRRQVAESYTGPGGCLAILSLPFCEALEFSQMRTLISDDHLSAENVFFIPAAKLLENLRNGHWMFATKQLGMDDL